MADDNPSELFMIFMPDKNGKAIDAEGQTDLQTSLSPSSTMFKDFEVGRVLQLETFSFKVGTIDESGDADASKKASGLRKKVVPKAGASSGIKPADLQAMKDLIMSGEKRSTASSTKGSYQAWRNGKDYKYPVDLRPIEITRKIDKASAHLMQSCIDCTSYDSASLIKRRAAGGAAAGEVFLRLDFNGVLVISVDWSNDEEVKESVQFICRSVTISYRPQLPSGKLGAVVPGFWSMVPDEKRVERR